MGNHASQRWARRDRCRRGRPPCLPISFEGMGRRASRDRATRAATVANHTDRGTSIRIREPGNHGGLPLRVADDGFGRAGFSLDAMPGVRAKPGVPNKANLRLFGAENEGRRENEANPREWQARHWGFEAVGRQDVKRTQFPRREKPPRRHGRHRDVCKCNWKKELGPILCALCISAVRRWGSLPSGPARGPECVKRTQFAAFLGKKRGPRWKTKPIWRDGRSAGTARPTEWPATRWGAQNVKQTQLAAASAIGKLALAAATRVRGSRK